MLNGIFSLKNPQSNEILQACQTYWRTETPTCKFSPGSTLSSHLGPCFIAAFNPAHDAAASCDECGKEGTVVFFFSLLWRRRTRRRRVAATPAGRADGIPVCLVCLKNTAGEAPSQTSQLHSPRWSQSFHCRFPPQRHQDLIPSPSSKSLHTAV